MKTIRLNSNENYIKPVITSSVTESSNLKQPFNSAQPSIGSNTDLKNTEVATGLVRRPSVTARPGDIFYKVKDVTESETADMIDQETSYRQEQITDSEEKEIIIKSVNKSYTISNTNSMNNNNNDLVSKTERQKEDLPSAVSNTSNYGSFSRKTTTWNKRHQTSALGVNVPQIDVISKASVESKSDEVIVENTAEPGSEIFNKELLSIR